jgi:predicted metalloendopeptidase
MTETYVHSLTACLLCGTDNLQDEVLAEAIAKADVEVEKIKQEVDAKKWRMVADRMKLMKVSTLLTRIRRTR